MTEPVGVVRGQLWPTRDRMGQYLDSWVTYTKELEEKLQTTSAAHAIEKQVLNERIAELRQEIGDTERPLLAKIASLESERVTLRAENISLRSEVDSATGLLAAAMEVTGTRHSLTALVNDAINLAEESKRIVRENL
jgi:predicted AAA+ superfamily ATPase